MMKDISGGSGSSRRRSFLHRPKREATMTTTFETKPNCGSHEIDCEAKDLFGEESFDFSEIQCGSPSVATKQKKDADALVFADFNSFQVEILRDRLQRSTRKSTSDFLFEQHDGNKSNSSSNHTQETFLMEDSSDNSIHLEHEREYAEVDCFGFPIRDLQPDASVHRRGLMDVPVQPETILAVRGTSHQSHRRSTAAARRSGPQNDATQAAAAAPPVSSAPPMQMRRRSLSTATRGVGSSLRKNQSCLSPSSGRESYPKSIKGQHQSEERAIISPGSSRKTGLSTRPRRRNSLGDMPGAPPTHLLVEHVVSEPKLRHKASPCTSTPRRRKSITQGMTSSMVIVQDQDESHKGKVPAKSPRQRRRRSLVGGSASSSPLVVAQQEQEELPFELPSKPTPRSRILGRALRRSNSCHQPNKCPNTALKKIREEKPSKSRRSTAPSVLLKGNNASSSATSLIVKF